MKCNPVFKSVIEYTSENFRITAYKSYVPVIIYVIGIVLFEQWLYYSLRPLAGENARI